MDQFGGKSRTNLFSSKGLNLGLYSIASNIGLSSTSIINSSSCPTSFKWIDFPSCTELSSTSSSSSVVEGVEGIEPGSLFVNRFVRSEEHTSELQSRGH